MSTSSTHFSLEFRTEDPFPLYAEGAFSYLNEKNHSEKVDEWLELRVQEIESILLEKKKKSEKTDQQLWIGLAPEALLTPYTEIRLLLSRIDPKPGDTIVDLGAGYGRMGFVIGHHYPEVKFIGYEMAEERVLEANRCLKFKNHPRVEMKVQDLTAPDFLPAAAQAYFLYDYGSTQAIEKTLNDLQKIAATQSITVIGRGRASRDVIERQNPWLSQVIAPSHYPHYSIYRSAESP